jgi:oligopeptide/dipeptide ABC transporter ATP-binding protein
VDEIFYEPRMPYTLGLIGSLPRMDEDRGHRLTPVHGTPPSMLNMPPGCPFRPRCPMHQDICAEVEPPLMPVSGTGHVSACHFSDQLEGKAPDDVFAPVATDLSVEAEVEAAEAQAAAAAAETSEEKK